MHLHFIEPGILYYTVHFHTMSIFQDVLYDFFTMAANMCHILYLLQAGKWVGQRL